MNLRAIAGLSLLVGSPAWAQQPAGSEPAPASTAQSAPTAASVPANPSSLAPTAQRPPLDLRIRDIREYMTPEEYRALLTAHLDDRNTVIVQAEAEELPMKSENPVPGGIIAPFWAIANPTQAWRILLPDLRRGPSGPPDPMPPPAYRMSGP